MATRIPTLRTRSWIALGLLALLPGCLSDLRPDAPQSIRFFSAAPDSEVDAVEPRADLASLRLGRVRAADHLTNRLVWRVSPVEYGFYELSRWTEAPEMYLERRLERSLFVERGVPRTITPDRAVLDATLVGFEEDLEAGRAARVAIAFHLTRGSEVLWSQTLEHRIEFTSTDRAVLAHSLGQALEQLVERAAERVVTRL